MKKIILVQIAIIALMLSAGNLFAQTDPGDWTPSYTSPGAQVKWLEYDMTQPNGRLMVRLVGIDIDYYYDWLVTDMAAIARAHAFYTSLLTAKSSGIPVHIRHTNGTNGTNTTRIQVIHLE